uniref:Neuropilin and tolloid like 2 n=1 Tax=Eptatretus burgeri TaxID=7764 RepID=A0A8C4WVA3_EPTBU
MVLSCCEHGLLQVCSSLLLCCAFSRALIFPAQMELSAWAAADKVGLDGVQRVEAARGVWLTNKCEPWVESSVGGRFTSPNYPNHYPLKQDCIFTLQAGSRQHVKLVFETPFSLEPSLRCKFDHVEIRDGPFGYSPLLGRFCGPTVPPTLTSTGRFMWVKFHSDEELQGTGFAAHYSYVPDPDLQDFGGLHGPLPECEFEFFGSDGVIRSRQAEVEAKVVHGYHMDCSWIIRAPQNARLYLRFLEFDMQYSNECKKNFIAVYDGGSGAKDLKMKFCSTVASDMPLRSGVAVVRMWARNDSRLSHFRLLYTAYLDPPCDPNMFFCHSNMCINSSLVCNGFQNCAYPWDETHCQGEKKTNFWKHLTMANGTAVVVSAAAVLLLLALSIYVQITQPRKKRVPRNQTTPSPAPTFTSITPELPRAPSPPSRAHPPALAPPLPPPMTPFAPFTLTEKDMYVDLADLQDERGPEPRPHGAPCRCVREHHCGGPMDFESPCPNQPTVPLMTGPSTALVEHTAPVPPQRMYSFGNSMLLLPSHPPNVVAAQVGPQYGQHHFTLARLGTTTEPCGAEGRAVLTVPTRESSRSTRPAYATGERTRSTLQRSVSVEV